MYTERTKDKDNNPLDFHNAVWFNFGKGERSVNGKLVVADHPKEVWVRFTYNATEEPHSMCYYKKKQGQVELDQPPLPLYTQYPLPIEMEKANDPHKLMNEFVPQEHRHFYAVITTTEDDTDDET